MGRPGRVTGRGGTGREGGTGRGGGSRQGGGGQGQRGSGQGRGGSGQRGGGSGRGRVGWGGRHGQGQSWDSWGENDCGEQMAIAPEEEDLLVVTEDVDDDPRGATATLKDDLMLLITVFGGDESCQKMLDEILEAEAKEVRAHSVARVQDWLST